MDLGEKLAALAHTMSEAERANYKLLLGMAAGGLVRGGRPPETRAGAIAFATAIYSISRLQPHRHRVGSDGIIFRGTPSFMNEQLLLSLRRESRELRSAAVRFDDHFVARVGPIASEVAVSTELDDVLNRYTDHITPTGRANYLYYDQPGLGIDPHVDNEEFSLNVIMMLEHVYRENPSALVLYPGDGPMQRIFLSPGEIIALYADSVTHARERMAIDERVSIAAF